MTNGELRGLLEQVLGGGPTGPRVEAVARLTVELQALAWRLLHSDRAAAAREAMAREGGEAIEQPRA
jgi:hypothetical protein